MCSHDHVYSHDHVCSHCDRSYDVQDPFSEDIKGKCRHKNLGASTDRETIAGEGGERGRRGGGGGKCSRCGSVQDGMGGFCEQTNSVAPSPQASYTD
jgi:hypothetical protein